MGLEKNIPNKYDGTTVPGFHVIDQISIDFPGNKAQLYGRVFSSFQAMADKLEPLEYFSEVFYDMKALLATFPSSIEVNAYSWLKSVAKYSDAIEKENPVIVEPEETKDSEASESI